MESGLSPSEADRISREGILADRAGGCEGVLGGDVADRGGR